MKRLDVNVTDSISDVLENLKRKTERSKTELIHDAVGLLWLAEKTYAQGHAFAEIDGDGAVISRFHMPMFERPPQEPVEEPDWTEAVAKLTRLIENSLSSMERQSSVPAAAVRVGGRDLSSYLGGLMERAKIVEQRQVPAG